MSLPLTHAGGSVDGISAALDLRFASSLSLTSTSGITPSYSRASTGTYFNASGVLTSAAINGPRFNHVYNGSSWVSRGLLIEEQRTNILLYSEDISYGGWTKTDASVSVNSGIAPDGNMTADKLVENTASGVAHRMYYSLSMGTSSTFSAFFKAAGRNYVMMMIYPGTAKLAYFDILNGSVVSTNAPEITAKVQPVGNGWFRCSVTYSGALSSSFIQIHMSPDGITDTYTGDGASGMFIWGLQAENNVSFPTSYIPTTSAAVTRSADVCQITGTDFSGFWNLSAGTIVVDGDSVVDPSITGGAYEFWSIHGTPTIEYYYRGSSGFVVVDNSVRKNVIAIPAANTRLNTAIAFTASDFAASVNGAAVTTSASMTMPVTPTVLGVGNYSTVGGFQVNGHIARLRYYAIRLPNRLLIAKST